MITATDGMSENNIKFYLQTISDWLPEKDATILVIGGGLNDRNVFFQLGFRNVIISNIDLHMNRKYFAPYTWRNMDAENLNCENDEFEYVIAHASLHHCASPHRALLEMYRVAHKAIIIIEARDSLVMKIMEILGLALTYETAAVYANGCGSGGVRNTQIPNFIYRWTEREIEKTISSNAPYAHHTFHYKYGINIALTSENLHRRFLLFLISLLTPIYKGFAYLFPRQQNLFACKIDKPELPQGLHPWLEIASDGEIIFNQEWAKKIYHKYQPSK